MKNNECGDTHTKIHPPHNYTCTYTQSHTCTLTATTLTCVHTQPITYSHITYMHPHTPSVTAV